MRIPGTSTGRHSLQKFREISGGLLGENSERNPGRNSRKNFEKSTGEMLGETMIEILGKILSKVPGGIQGKTSKRNHWGGGTLGEILERIPEGTSKNLLQELREEGQEK